MKNILLALSILAFVGCEEIIELDLNSTNSEIIIEANLTNNLENNIVKITESTDFFTPAAYKSISNAEVIIKDNSGTSYILEEIAEGEYKNNTLIANEESTYNIEVNYGGNNYSAQSYSPPSIKIDSLTYLLEDRPFGDQKKQLELHVYFQDNHEQVNYAKFNIYNNGKRIKNIFLYDDRLTNGNYIDFFFFSFRDEEFVSGDVLTVELLSIDEQTNTYFKTLRKALTRSSGGPFGSSAPANPITNWNNNAFGYFSASTISTMEIVLQ